MSRIARTRLIVTSLMMTAAVSMGISFVEAQNPDCIWSKIADAEKCATSKNSFNCQNGCSTTQIADGDCQNGRKYSGNTIYGKKEVEAGTGDLDDGNQQVACSLPVTCVKQTLNQHVCPGAAPLICNATTNPNDRCYQCQKNEGNTDQYWPSFKTAPCPPGTP